MADSHILTALNPSLCAPSTCFSGSSVTRTPTQIRSSIGFTTENRRSPSANTTPLSKIWGNFSSCRHWSVQGRKPCQQEVVTAIAASSRDSGAFGADDNEGFKWSGWSPKDGNGLYPWDPSWDSITLDDLQWVQEDVVTLFTSEGVVRIGGSRLTARRATVTENKQLSRLRRYREEDYMDPKQGLCLGAIFDIAATNGLDMSRRFCVFGFCRSIEMLSDVVEDTVLELGGEVLVAEKETSGGLHEKLIMTVAMPALWGVPPAVDKLNYAIRTGGGIVEKTYKKWEFF
ncbi:hypothetical protein Mapa_014836 [Marchantia paleacea]|nr:hypothetical protein Mapa_014836 [Marchantia paleacea]